jgi:DNA-binding transcriptional LysR family regulator
MALLLPKGHRLAGKRAVLAGELEGEDLLVTEQGCAYRGLVERALGERGVRPRWALESGSVASLREAVRQRFGLAVIPRLAASPAPRGTVVRRFSDLVIALPVGLVTRPGSAPGPPALVALIEEFRKVFGRAKKEIAVGFIRRRTSLETFT